MFPGHINHKQTQIFSITFYVIMKGLCFKIAKNKLINPLEWRTFLYREKNDTKMYNKFLKTNLHFIYPLIL